MKVGSGGRNIMPLPVPKGHFFFPDLDGFPPLETAGW